MNIAWNLFAKDVIRHAVNVIESSVLMATACLHVILVVEQAVMTVTMFFGALIVETKPIAEDATMAKSILWISAVIAKIPYALIVFLLKQDVGLA